MAARLQEMIEAFQEQTTVVKTLKNDQQKVREAVASLYITIAKNRTDYVNSKNVVESSTHPAMSQADVVNMTIEDLVRKIGTAHSAHSSSLQDVRAELSSIQSLLGPSVDEALDSWNTVAEGVKNSNKSKTFRDHNDRSDKTASQKDGEHTSESRKINTAMPASSQDRNDSTDTNRRHPKEESTGKSKKAGTTTMGNLFSRNDKNETGVE